MRKIRRTFKKPKQPWDKERMDKETQLRKFYGLRRKYEIWKAESILRSFRIRARDLAAKKDKAEEKTLLEKLYKMGLLGKNANLDDVLTLTINNILERRLQTVVFRKNLANTAKQARQFITHGHILIESRKITYPSFIVSRDLEDKISYLGKIPLKTKEPEKSE